ncbi:MAG: Prephenate dehydrogenase [Candidatus Dichloromethanomonas elyunquensis]|nr:MAG: Prephenate dehydrogenase [Candidatus Dichloromethanomonas elyunquensis]
MEEADFRGLEITIVGLGLIGGSYASALRKMNPKKLWAIDIERDILDQAENRGIIDGGYIEGASVLKRSDLVIISVYPELTVRFIQENLDYFKPGSVLTDAAGIKKKVIDDIRKFIRKDLDFVGGHPLAGKECSGFANASSDIFMGANYIVTPVPENKRSSLLLVEKMIRGIGCREPILMNPEEHDQVIALTSQLPHLIAAALINSSEFENIGSLIGGSFKDATRVAKMNVTLWSELLLENKENILTQIKVFADNITRFQNALQKEDSTSLAELLEKANRGREKL